MGFNVWDILKDVADPIQLWYTFGNHMHWVDMQWLWGYHVMPGSTFDMLKFCRETGAKGNVNFDGIGYEKMAAEAPEALTTLRDAVAEGTVEVVGGSYGQPYGLFHGGESNIRQRIYGVRTAMRLLGKRPRTFWEEEFDFFPQLPQMLKGCGFDGASLYFQWTWHTPEVPFEASPVVWWEGVDGSKLLAATRNRLNLHQWPEDFQILLDELAEAGPREVLKRGAAATEKKPDVPRPAPEAISRWEGEGGHVEERAERVVPLVLQWLELMPSPDWMCRSELMIPKLRELLDDERFEVVFGTLGDYLDHARGAEVPIRRYGMHEVWHGLSLGKNADEFRRKSRFAEELLLGAESQSAALSLFGRPYAHWDVYPVWELEEGWRKLLAAQHHDNDECEGLCGRVGEIHYDTAQRHAGDVLEWKLDFFRRNFAESKGVAFPMAGTGSLLQGWSFDPHRVPRKWEQVGDELHGLCGDFLVRIAADRPVVLSVGERTFEPPLDCGFGFEDWKVTVKDDKVKFLSGDANCALDFDCSDQGDGLDIRVRADLECEKPGFGGARYWEFELAGLSRIQADTAYCVDDVRAEGEWSRKYPEGDWMTSPQWFETVQRPFVAQSLVDFEDEQGHLLLVQDRTRQWFRDGDRVRFVVNLRDPWDEDNKEDHVDFQLSLVPHKGFTRAELWRRSQTSARMLGLAWCDPILTGQVPLRFCAVRSETPGVEVTAFYREAEDFAGRGLESYAGRGIGYPFVVRLVEFEGAAGEAVVRVAGTVAAAHRTNLMGEIEKTLEVEVVRDDAGWQRLFGDTYEGEVEPNLFGIYSVIRLPMSGREIATVYLDIVEGRKVPRDLDAHRQVWATVHRTNEE